jgi:hypothetical protein
MKTPAILLPAIALTLAIAAAWSAEPAQGGKRTSPGPYRALPLKVVKVDEKSITVYPRVNAKVEQMTFAIDPQITIVWTHAVVDQRTNEKGQVVYRSKIQAGTLDDIEVGRDVYIGSNNDDVAVDVIVAPRPPAKGGDGVKPKQGEKK